MKKKRKDYHGRESPETIRKKLKLVRRLEIHHFDIGQGDATLLLAKQGDRIERSMLVDGGDWGWGAMIAKHLDRLLGGRGLDVMVITHFDEDHFCGAAELLGIGLRYFSPEFRLIDQGAAANSREDWWVYPENWETSTDKANRKWAKDGDGSQKGYVVYKNNFTGLASKLTKIKRVTEKVDAEEIAAYGGFGGTETPTLPKRKDYTPADTLLGQELMWAGTERPGPAPTVTCLAANKWIETAAGTHALTPPRIIMVGDHPSNEREIWIRPCEHDSNEQSIALLIEFGGFRYYMAGDLPRKGEDVLAKRLNTKGDLAGRVHAIKVSHHGSAGATSKAFLQRLMPQLAFISVGRKNRHNLPSEATLDRMDTLPDTKTKWKGLQRYYATTSGCRKGKNQEKTSDIPKIGGHIKLEVVPAKKEMTVTWRTGKIIDGGGISFAEEKSQSFPIQETS